LYCTVFIEKYRSICNLHGLSEKDCSFSNVYMDISENMVLELPSSSQLYELVPNNVKNTLDLNKTGDNLDAPYSFIEGISLVREEVYDRKGEQTC